MQLHVYIWPLYLGHDIQYWNLGEDDILHLHMGSCKNKQVQHAILVAKEKTLGSPIKFVREWYPAWGKKLYILQEICSMPSILWYQFSLVGTYWTWYHLTFASIAGSPSIAFARHSWTYSQWHLAKILCCSWRVFEYIHIYIYIYTYVSMCTLIMYILYIPYTCLLLFKNNHSTIQPRFAQKMTSGLRCLALFPIVPNVLNAIPSWLE